MRLARAVGLFGLLDLHFVGQTRRYRFQEGKKILIVLFTFQGTTLLVLLRQVHTPPCICLLFPYVYLHTYSILICLATGALYLIWTAKYFKIIRILIG